MEQMKKLELSCYSIIEAGIEDLKKRHLGVVVDVSNKEGMSLAIKGRAELREIRLNIEKIRKQEKEYFLVVGKKIDESAKLLTSIISPMELSYDNAIKEDDRRKEEEIRIRQKAEAEALAEKIREEETIKREIEANIQAEKDRISAEEKAKFEAEQEKFRLEKEEFEKARKKKEQDDYEIELARKERQVKIDKEIREAQEKVDEENRILRKKIEDAERLERLRIENDQRAERERIALAEAEKVRKEEIRRKAEREIEEKKEAARKAERLKEEELIRKIEMEKQNKLNGNEILIKFITNHSKDSEFKDIVMVIKKWLITNGVIGE